MKLPNGYGSVVHLKGKRRNPYCVRKTVGWTDKGYPKYFIVGYTKTRTEGLALLAKYNKDPWTNARDITLGELFKKWKEDRMPLLSPANAEKISFSHNHTKSLDKHKYREIKLIRCSRQSTIVVKDTQLKRLLSLSGDIWTNMRTNKT